MALTEKGLLALKYINKYFDSAAAFSAKDLSDKCGEKIVGATLNSIVGNGYLQRLGGSPVLYQPVAEFSELMDAMEAEASNAGCDNSNLRAAKRAKNDEFYTLYRDIEIEVMKYRKQFRDKIVYLPCDDPAEKKSEFWSFFVNNFDAFGLKKLIATHYDENDRAYKIWIDSDVTGDGYIDDGDALQESLEGNGDFRSPECMDIMRECDIVVTNPPFSLFREFVEALMSVDKKFLIIGNKNAFTYKEIFPLIKDNKIWTGWSQPKDFRLEDGSITSKMNGLCRWFTNMPVNRRNEELILVKKYNPIDYPKYDNYDAIEVSRVINIPKDYYGVMGVPITFIDKYSPEQFEILRCSAFSNPEFSGCGALYVNSNKTYARVLVKRI